MANSINTNYGAAIALQNLNKTNAQLETTQNRINTGQNVSSAKDNGAIFAIATTQRANMGAMDAVKNSNLDVGGGLVESSSMEYMIRSLGYIHQKSDLEKIVLMAGKNGAPVTVGDVATVQMGGS